MAATSVHRLNVPSRPTGSSPTPTAASSPWAPCSSALTGPLAARKRAQAATRTRARVSTATGPLALPRSRPASTSAPRHRPCPPIARNRTSYREDTRARAASTYRSRSASLSHTANIAVRRRSADGAVSLPRPVPSSQRTTAPSGRRNRSLARRDIAVTGPGCTTRWNEATLAMRHAGTVRGWTRVVVPAVAGYLLGSIPTAVIVGRRRHVDLRRVGDRNPGWWNAKEELGGRAAAPVLVVDVTKGAAAAGIGRVLARPGEWWPGYVGAAAAMVGHAWPLFARFRGGRSVATLGGVAPVLTPVATAG